MSWQVHVLSRRKQFLQVLLVAVFLSIGIYSPQVVDLLRTGVMVRGDRADMGTVARGDVIKHKFIVRNIALRTNTIVLAEPSCTCSVAAIGRYTLPPLCSTTIRLKVRTLDSTPGKQTKGILLTFKNGKKVFPYIRFFLRDKPRSG